MKKYTQAGTKIFMYITIMCFLVTVVVLIISLAVPEQFNMILLSFISIPLGILFLIVWLTCAHTYLLIDDVKIVFPITRAPKLRFKRNHILFSDVERIEVQFYPGSDCSRRAILTNDTKMYRFVLKNGLSFTEVFCNYGKKNEEEIVNILKSKVDHI